MLADRTIALYTESMKKLFGSIAGRNGISVRFDKDCKVPQANSNMVVTLPYPTAIDAGDFWFDAFHELSHLLEEMDWSYGELNYEINMKDELVSMIANIIIDNLAEYNFYGEFEGVDGILTTGRGEASRKLFKALETAGSVPPVMELVITLCQYDIVERQDWMGYHVESIPLQLDKFKKFSDLCKKVKYVERLKELQQLVKPAKETASLIYDILKEIDYEPPPPEEKPEDGQDKGGEGEGDPSEGKGEGGKGKGEGKDESEGEDESEGKGKSSGSDHPDEHTDNSETPDHMGTGKDKTAIIKAHDLSPSNVEMVKNMISSPITKKLDADVEPLNFRWGCEDYVPTGDNKILDISKLPGEPRDGYRRSIETALGSSTVSKQISRFLKALTSESYTYGTKQGRIHQKNIHRVVSGKPQPGVSPGIFKKRNATALKADSTVTLLLDCSGSMSSYGKYFIGAACVVALSETLSSLQIQHEIIGFTDRSRLLTYIFKPYGVPISKEKLLDGLSDNQIYMGSNADGESLTYAAERLLSRKEKRKLMVVLSDGQPAGSFRGDGDRYLKKVCTMIEDDSPIDLVGIGICTEVVERFYKNNVTVDKVENLDAVLFGVLRNFLTR